MATIKRKGNGIVEVHRNGDEIVEIHYESVAVKPQIMTKEKKSHQYCQEAHDQELIDRYRAMDVREQVLIANEFIKLYGGTDEIRIEEMSDLRKRVCAEKQGTSLLRLRMSENIEPGEREATYEDISGTEAGTEAKRGYLPNMRKIFHKEIG